jgi:hypothetical protein
MSVGGGESGILVKCRVHPLSLLLLPFRTIIVVDESSVRGRWGEQFFPCEPGSHKVSMSFRYLWENLGDATLEVQVNPGETVRVNYKSPPMFSLFLTSRSGSIQIAAEAD